MPMNLMTIHLPRRSWIAPLMLAGLMCAPHAWAGCSLSMSTPAVVFADVGAHQTGQSTYLNAIVSCDAGLPYRLDSDAPNGVVGLTSGASVIPVQVKDASTQLPVGTQADGLGITSVGTGADQAFPLELDLQLNGLPAVGTYQGQVELVVSF